MNPTQCFKSKEGTPYAVAVKKHFTLLPKWNRVYGEVSKLLGETITQIALTNETLVVDYAELTTEENKKMFKKDGQLKSNTKKAKQLLIDYQGIIEQSGLSGYVELSKINFMYGVMRMRGQSLQSFKTAEHEIYFKADFNLAARVEDMVEPISEVTYQEKYLKELKKLEEEKANEKE